MRKSRAGKDFDYYIDEYMYYCRSRKLRQRTMQSYEQTLRLFERWCLEVEGIKKLDEIRETTVRQLKNERTAQEYLTDEELEKLRKKFDLSYFSEHRDYTIIMLLIDSGMRIGECLRIEMKDVNMAERSIILPAEHTKGRQSRYVFFSVKMARILQKWLRFKDRYSESNLLFLVKKGTLLGIGSFEGKMRKYLERAGIEKNFHRMH